MSTISFDSLHPDVVVVGGGPVGLWTAIQTKILTKKDILVIEKYAEYKRADIRLNINASSFGGIPDHEPLKKLVQKWGNKAVPIKEMEDELTKCASDLGIRIITGQTVNPKQLQEQFPTARVFIGADGARSAVRKEIFGDQYKFNTALQYLVQARYMIKTPIEDDLQDTSIKRVRRVAENYSKQKFAGHLIIQNITPKENGQSEVTLRIFIQEKTYREMADATFSNPYYFETDLDKVPDLLRETLIKWWGTHNQDIITDIIKTNKLTVIPLASYAAKNVFKSIEKKDTPEEQVVMTLVGDASQAYPFFRAVNNGLLLGTRLAKCIDSAFKTLRKEERKALANQQERAKLFASCFNSYSRYSTRRAYVEYIRACVKNSFIVLSSLWIQISRSVPWQTLKLNEKEQKKCYKKGCVIWGNLQRSPR